MAQKKTIPLLPEIIIPDINGYTAFDDGSTTYKLSLDNLLNFIYDNQSGMVTGGTYDSNTGRITFITKNGSPIYVTGLTNNTSFWLTDENKILNEGETILISGDYVLENTTLTLNSSNTQISNGNMVFNKNAQIFIGGYLVLINSNIINNGLINIGGSCILIGNSTITGTGIIN
jgi:hypothetical protein